MLKGKHLNGQAQTMLICVYQYFRYECHKGGPVLPLESIQQRTADACGVSPSTVSRAMKRFMETDGKLLEFNSHKRKRTKKAHDSEKNCDKDEDAKGTKQKKRPKDGASTMKKSQSMNKCGNEKKINSKKVKKEEDKETIQASQPVIINQTTSTVEIEHHEIVEKPMEMNQITIDENRSIPVVIATVERPPEINVISIERQQAPLTDELVPKVVQKKPPEFNYFYNLPQYYQYYKQQ